jgi:predicted nucleotidyltransferase
MSTILQSDSEPTDSSTRQAKEASTAYLANADSPVTIMVDRIVRRFQPLRIILFGSRARGDAQPDSDVDLLVVFPQVANKRSKAIEIRQILSDLRVAKDIIVSTPDEIARRGDLVGDVLRPALAEGKVLYERS